MVHSSKGDTDLVGRIQGRTHLEDTDSQRKGNEIDLSEPYQKLRNCLFHYFAEYWLYLKTLDHWENVEYQKVW